MMIKLTTRPAAADVEKANYGEEEEEEEADDNDKDNDDTEE